MEDSSMEVQEKHTKASFQDQCHHLRHRAPGRVGLVQMEAHKNKIEAHKAKVEFHNSMLNLDYNLSTLNTTQVLSSATRISCGLVHNFEIH